MPFGKFDAGGYLEGLRMRRQDDLAERDMRRNERMTDSSIRVNDENVLTSYQRRMFDKDMNPYRLEGARLQNDTRFLQNKGLYAQNKFNLKANPLKLESMQLENQGRQIQNKFNTEANPLRLGGMQLENQSRQIQNDFNKQANPMRLQGIGLQNQGRRLANAGRAFSNQFARQTAPMKIAAMQRSAKMAATLDPLKIQQFKTQLRNTQLKTDMMQYEYDRTRNMNAVDDASKLFRLQGTSPRPLTDAINKAYGTAFYVDQDTGSVLSNDLQTGDSYEMNFNSGSQMEQYFRSLAPQSTKSRSAPRLTPLQRKAAEEQRQAAMREAIDARMRPPIPPFVGADQ